MKRYYIFIRIFMIGSIVLNTNISNAQTYPTKTVQFVIPGTPGSIIDITGRILAEELGKILGQPFIPNK